MRSAVLFVACLAGFSLPELAHASASNATNASSTANSSSNESSCDDSKCNSTDCCAPAQFEIEEPQICRDGYVAHDLERGCYGYPQGLYTCCAPGSTPPPSAFEPEEDWHCDDSKCSSNGGDCCAPDQIGEPKNCSDGYVSRDLGQGCYGYSEGTYTCCAPGEAPHETEGDCDDSKCSSYGDDCCAPAQIGEPKSCRDGYEAHDLGRGCFGHSEGTYTCCKPGSAAPPGAVAPQEVEDGCEAKCTSLFNDCCAPHGEEQSCPFGKKAKVVGECLGDPNGMYVCCDDTGAIILVVIIVGLVLLGSCAVIACCCYYCHIKNKPRVVTSADPGVVVGKVVASHQP